MERADGVAANAGMSFAIPKELIAVVGVALLAGVLLPELTVDIEKCGGSRDARRAADLKNVQAALESYRRDHGAYPSTDSQWRGDAGDFGSHSYDAAGFIPGLVPNYLPALPKDPDTQHPTIASGYRYRSDGVDYKMILDGTPETFPSGNPFYDPERPATSWQVSSPGGFHW